MPPLSTTDEPFPPAPSSAALPLLALLAADTAATLERVPGAEARELRERLGALAHALGTVEQGPERRALVDELVQAAKRAPALVERWRTAGPRA